VTLACRGGGGAVMDPLLSSCLKRQLAGSVVAAVDLAREEDRTATAARIRLAFGGSTWRFAALRAVARGGGGGSRRGPPPPFRILPGTRITMERGELWSDERPLEGEGEGEEGEEEEEGEEGPSATLSPAAQLLVDTIRCLGGGWSDVPRGYILTGPPGTGKTFAVRQAVRHAANSRLTVVRGSELLGDSSSSSSSAAAELQRRFARASAGAADHRRRRGGAVAVVFLDELDALTSSEPVAAALAWLLDRHCGAGEKKEERLLVVAATNRIDGVPAALRRPGRFDREIPLSPPDAVARLSILESLLLQQQRSSNASGTAREDLSEIAEECVGYVPADLAALVRRAERLRLGSAGDAASMGRLSRVESLRMAMSDVGASALRGAALAAPPVTTWDDIAGDPGGSKTALRRAIEWPRTRAAAYRLLGLTPPRGILLHGPPGCAKTTLARAAAGSVGVAFLSFAPADVYASSYAGDAEAVVRRTFTLARAAAPCVLFFDEIDSILGTKDAGAAHGMSRQSTEARVLSTFLNEMDGVDGSTKDGVLVLGATNRPWTLDAALLRPGRFDKIIYVPPPDWEGRRSILELQFRHWNGASSNMNLDALADRSEHFTGAEIVGACREAAFAAFRRAVESGRPPALKQADVEAALANVQPLLACAATAEHYRSFE
jgi:SpoVK/Ycf46/Vps4 family AAA+-type ATPase